MTEMLDLVLRRDDLADLDVASRRLALRSLLHAEDAIELLPSIADHVDGCGPLEPFLQDPSVTDILVNGHDEIWVERDGSLQRTAVAFQDQQHLIDLIERMLGRVGRRADAAHPVEDARLPDGSRMHVVMPPLAGAEPVVSIRVFPRSPIELGDLVDRHMLSSEQAGSLAGWVEDRDSILVAGATGAGKTTLLNALISTIPRAERVITIEETPEIRRPGAHHVPLIARAATTDGRGGVSLEDLLRVALRMRPDRIVVGEVRGPEARVAIDAMSTGHEGSLLTIHAASGRGALDRLHNLSARPGDDAGALEARISAAIQHVVFLDRDRATGARRVAQVLST